MGFKYHSRFWNEINFCNNWRYQSAAKLPKCFLYCYVKFRFSLLVSGIVSLYTWHWMYSEHYFSPYCTGKEQASSHELAFNKLSMLFLMSFSKISFSLNPSKICIYVLQFHLQLSFVCHPMFINIFCLFCRVHLYITHLVWYHSEQISNARRTNRVQYVMIF